MQSVIMHLFVVVFCSSIAYHKNVKTALVETFAERLCHALYVFYTKNCHMLVSHAPWTK